MIAAGYDAAQGEVHVLPGWYRRVKVEGHSCHSLAMSDSRWLVCLLVT